MATQFLQPSKMAVERSSLACLPCRSRHLKCDGGRPQCSRCSRTTKTCTYTKSRRGGLDRETLAKRRRQIAACAGRTGTGASGENPSTAANDPRLARQIGAGGLLSPCPRPPASAAAPSHDIRLPSSTEDSEYTGVPVELGISEEIAAIGTCSLPSASVAPPLSTHPILPNGQDVEGDPIVDMYYRHFHRFHPLALPQKHLARYCRDPARGPGLRPLVTVLRLIGHIYDTKEWSTKLEESVNSFLSDASLSEPSSSPPATSSPPWNGDPIKVQCRLLYSVALFWQGRTPESMRELDLAAKLAVSLGMNRKEFAQDHGEGDPVLMECWRRTWWMLFIVDAYYSGTQGTMMFAVLGVDSTVDLPCEEAEYESGDIPEPKTEQDFSNREFSFGEIPFSSFAYLIGAVKCVSFAMMSTPRVASKQDSTHIMHAADSMLDGWLLLLPKGSKEVMGPNGEIDELMFQAHLVIHVATIGLHRPLSDLKFNAVEDVSSCSREPPPDVPTPELVNVHTVRVMRAVEAQIRLLALPSRPFDHTPFTTCMISKGVLSLLSACRFLLRGHELAIAREQIRMTIGCLRSIGELWPRTARNVREIQLIARYALGLDTKGESARNGSGNGSSHIAGGSVANSWDSGANVSDETPLRARADGQPPSFDYSQTRPDNLDEPYPALGGNIEDVCGWYSLGSVGTELSWWSTGQ